jgi:hypothetical protein
MAKRRKRRKARKSSSKGWSPAKLRAYKRAKRKVINAFNRKGSHGSVRISIG